MTFYTKSILSLVLLGSALFGLLAMLELMGRKEKRFSPKVLRLVHRVNGYFFFLFILVISYFCIHIMRGSGQELSPRAALHSLLAVSIFLFLCLKITISRFYRQFFSMMVPLGITVFMLSLGTIATSAGYYSAMRGGAGSVAEIQSEDTLVQKGTIIFNQNCVDCHYMERKNTKIGPGLAGLFKQASLPFSNRPVTEPNIRAQIRSPFKAMPPFPDLTDEEIDALIAFLKTL